MDDLIAVHDLLDEILRLRLIHVPYLLDAHFIGLHEVLKLSLEIGELLSKLFVLNSEIAVSLLSLLLFGEKLLLYLALNFFELALLFSLRLNGCLIDLDLLLEDAVVESKLLLVELVDSLHVLHAFLQDLHLLLQLDLLLRLIVSVQVSDFFQLLGVGLFSLGAMLGVFFFDLFLLLEELLDLRFILVQDLCALVLECLLNADQVLLVSRAEGFVLLLHLVDKLVDVVVHAAHSLYVLLILALELLHKLVD